MNEMNISEDYKFQPEEMDDTQTFCKNFKASSSITSSTPKVTNKPCKWEFDESAKSERGDVPSMEAELLSFSGSEISDGNTEELLAEREDDFIEENSKDGVDQNAEDSILLDREETLSKSEDKFYDNSDRLQYSSIEDFATTHDEEMEDYSEVHQRDEFVEKPDIEESIRKGNTEILMSDQNRIVFDESMFRKSSQFYSNDSFVDVLDEEEETLLKDGNFDEPLRNETVGKQSMEDSIYTEDSQDSTEPKHSQFYSNDNFISAYDDEPEDSDFEEFPRHQASQNQSIEDPTFKKMAHESYLEPEGQQHLHPDDNFDNSDCIFGANKGNFAIEDTLNAGEVDVEESHHKLLSRNEPLHSEENLPDSIGKCSEIDSRSHEGNRDVETEATKNADSTVAFSFGDKRSSTVMSSDSSAGIYLQDLRSRINSLSSAYNSFKANERSVTKDISHFNFSETFISSEISPSKGQAGKEDIDLISDSRYTPFTTCIPRIIVQDLKQIEPDKIKKELESDICHYGENSLFSELHAKDSGNRMDEVDPVPSIEHKDTTLPCISDGDITRVSNKFSSEDSKSNSEFEAKESFSPKQENEQSGVPIEEGALKSPIMFHGKVADMNSDFTYCYYCPQCKAGLSRPDANDGSAETEGGMVLQSKTSSGTKLVTERNCRTEIFLELFNINNVLSREILLELKSSNFAQGATMTGLLKQLKQKAAFKSDPQLKQDLQAFLKNAVIADILIMKTRKYFLSEVTNDGIKSTVKPSLKLKSDKRESNSCTTKSATSSSKRQETKSSGPSKVNDIQAGKSKSVKQISIGTKPLKDNLKISDQKRKHEMDPDSEYKELRSRKILKVK